MAVNPPTRRQSRISLFTVLMFIPVLCIAGFFFAIKFYELVLVAKSDPDGAFAVTPIVNYLLAGFGFLCLFIWAAANGMFHDVEQPKHTMLENEQRLDAQEQGAPHREQNDRRGKQ